MSIQHVLGGVTEKEKDLKELEDEVFPAPNNLFLFLLVGLEAQREQEAGIGNKSKHFYPYPDTLRVAWNALGYHGLTSAMVAVPRTLSGLRKRCTRPVGEWLPPALIPSDFPSNAPILYPGSAIELSDAAAGFLNDRIFADTDFAKIKLHDAPRLNRFLENQRFVELLKRLRAKVWTPALQAEYVELRRFLIENPYTTRAIIGRVFASASALSPADVGKLYESCYPNEMYYRCEKCGLLRTIASNRLVGSKPDVCTDHAYDAPHVHRVPWEEGMCRLVPGVHTRVALHGIAEVALFDQLHAMQQKYPKRIRSVEEWASIDGYDLRIVFADDTIWAVDIKDFADPHRLSSELTGMGVGADHARFDRAFYVVPKRRLTTNPNYLNDSRAGANKLPADYQLCDDEIFVALVSEYRPKKETPA
ncbi:MAG: hypothetical protein H8F28_14935 [Fibrella sp.]|nr:hypothetical protein [Armatimonadota bacterium]